MIFFLTVAVVLSGVIGLLAGVLIRRDRRRGDVNADGLRIESAAKADVREARRRARVGRDMNSPSTDVFLRDR